MARQTVLVIEDDPDILELLRFNLERDGFQVHTATSGEIGYREALRRRPDLVLLDLMLPGAQGLEVCRWLKEKPETAGIPLIMLTARTEESDVVLGLELGADDYVAKPFSPRELTARIRAVLRRASEKPASFRQETISVGPLRVDLLRHEVSLQGRPVVLTLAEFRLLTVLSANPGRVFSRDELLDHITGGKAVIIDRNVDVHVRAIRKKLGRCGSLIRTVRGIGYKLQML